MHARVMARTKGASKQAALATGPAMPLPSTCSGPGLDCLLTSAGALRWRRHPCAAGRGSKAGCLQGVKAGGRQRLGHVPARLAVNIGP